MRFEPMGHTKNPDIRIAKSIVDYIFRWLGITFLPGYKEANKGHVAEEPSPLAKVGDAPVQKPANRPESGSAGSKVAENWGISPSRRPVPQLRPRLQLSNPPRMAYTRQPMGMVSRRPAL